MKPNLFAVFCSLTLLAPAPSAHAVGACENTPITYELVGMSAATGQVLVKGEQEYCDVDDSGGSIEEDRGSVPFFQVRDLGGKGKTTWFLRRNSVTTRARFSSGTLPRKTKSFKALRKLRKKRSFTPAAKLAKAPSGACSVKVEGADEPEVDGEFPETVVTVSVHAKGKRIWSENLGAAAIAAGPRVLSMWSKTRKSLVLWADLPSCSGPPPGYFEGDAGDCYPEHEPYVVERPLADNPTLAVCFK